jgi:hypothetical protein
VTAPNTVVYERSDHYQTADGEQQPGPRIPVVPIRLVEPSDCARDEASVNHHEKDTTECV